MTATESRPLTTWKYVVLWILAFGWAAAYAAFAFANHKGPNTLNYYKRATLHKIVAGTADKPFVSRALVPLILRVADKAMVKHETGSTWQPNGDNPDGTASFTKSTQTFEVAAMVCLAWACFVGTGFFVAATCVRNGLSGLQSHMAGMFCILAVPVWARFYSWPYDPMTVFLCSWMLWALTAESLAWFCAGFLLMMANKETGLFWLPVLWFTLKRADARIAALVLGVVGVGITAYFRSRYTGNGGHDPEIHQWWPELLQTKQWTRPMVLVFYIPYLVLGIRGWSRASAAVRYSVAIVGGLCFLGTATIGNLDELRAMYDALPSLIVLVAPELFELMGRLPTGARTAANASS